MNLIKPLTKTKETKVKRIGILLLVLGLALTSIALTLSETQPAKLLYLSVEKPYYELGEKITLIITADNLTSYELSVYSNKNFYKYQGELKNNIDFYPKDEGQHKVDLTNKITMKVADSLSFWVGALGENITELPYDINNTDATSTEIINETTTTNLTNETNQTNQTTLSNATQGTQETNISRISRIILTDKETYIIGELVLASVNLPLAEQEKYRLYYEYEGFTQRYLGDFKEIRFVPRGIGKHYLVLKDLNNNEMERAGFEVVEQPPSQPSPSQCNAEDLAKEETPSTCISPTGTVEQAPRFEDTTNKILRLVSSKGLAERAIITLYDEQNKEINLSDINATNNTLGIKPAELAEIIPENKIFKRMVLKKLLLNLSQNTSFGIDQIPFNKINLGKKNVLKAFAIDASSLNFTNGTITGTAQGTELWKCKDWDFAAQTCLGTWQKIMDLTPGQDYDIEISPNDPGYAETGVASINTKKPIYHPNETADIIMVVLDTAGHLVKSANITLYITSPDNQTVLLTTDNGNIIETETGIYAASYANTGFEGNYSMTIFATGTNLNSTMYSYFTVKAYYEFDIIRNTPVTTDPWLGPINSSITITSHTGDGAALFNFTEVLPGSFEINNSGGATVTTANNKTYLTWTDLNNNSVISYSATPPFITPELYELGPSFVIYDNNNSADIFYEARPWYLAVDPQDEDKLPDGDGAYTGWTISGSSPAGTRWQSVDDPVASPDDGTTYIASPDDTSRNSFTFQNLSENPAAVNWVAVSVRARRSASGGSATLQIFYRQNGADYDNANTQALSTTWTSYSLAGWNYTTNPATGQPWNITTINNMEWGFLRNSSSANRLAWVTQIYVTVNYNSTNTPPNVSALNYPGNGSNITNSSNISFNFTVSDDRGFSNCTLYTNFTGSWLPNASITSVINNSANIINATLPDGNILWNIICWDNATVPLSGSYISNYTVHIDTTGPVTTLTSPANSANISSNTSVINATATDLTAVDTVTFMYRQNSSDSWHTICTNKTGGPAYTCTWNVTSLPDGKDYQIRAYANDTLGKTGNNDTHTNITIDRTGPTTTINQPTNFTNITTSTYTLNATATDMTAIHTVTFLYRQNSTTTWATACTNNTGTGPSYTCTWNLAALPDGKTYEIRAYANDTLGNIGNNDTRYNITVDRTGPNTTLDQPANFTNITTTTYTPNATATDLTGVDTVTFLYRQNASDTWHFACSDNRGPTYDCTWDLTGLPDSKTYEIRAYANDTFGTLGNNDTHTNITIDRTGPNTTIDNPDNGTNITTPSYQLNATVTDLTGVSTITFLYRQNSTATWNFACSNNSGSPYNCYWSTASLPEGNTYEVRAYANDTFGNVGNNDTRYNITINIFPTISNTGCFKLGVGWVNCTTITYGDTLDSVRTNCTSNRGGNISNVSFILQNINDNKTYFNDTITSTTNGYWEDNITDITIYDSGNFNLHITCRENQIAQEDTNWTIPWGTLSAQLVMPNTSTNVTQNQFFNFTASITCTGGECGYVNATLDPPLGWWDNAWDYRRAINLTEKSGFNLSNYQFNITINTQSLISAGKMNGSCSDMRFADNNSGALDYWIESGCNTTSTLVWVEYNLSAGNSTRIYMYYGNSNATSQSNASATMFIYENMSQAPSGTLSGSATYINSTNGVRLTTTGGGLTGYLYYTKNPGRGFRGRFQFWSGGGDGADAAWAGVHDTTTSGTTEDIVANGYHFTFDEYENRVAYTKSTTDNGPSIAEWANTTLDNSQWRFAEIYFFNNGSIANAKIYLDGGLRVNANDTSPQGVTGNYFSFGGRTGGSTNEHRVRNITIQEYVSPEPNITFGAEQFGRKGIIPMYNGTPFYTITQNPMNSTNNSCLANMTAGRSCNIIWRVNATGDVGTIWEFYAYFASMNYSANISQANTTKVNITIIANLAPAVSNVLLTPIYPLYYQDLNCSFVVTDANPDDSLTANVSWYKNGALNQSTVMSVGNGAGTYASLGSGNLTVGDIWRCGITPYDGALYGNQVNSSNVTILASNPPTVNQIQCQRDGGSWGSCSSVVYGSNLTAVRANCSSTDGYVINATFRLLNIEDAKEFFNGTTTDNSSVYFEYDNDDIIINDSGTFNLSVTCYDNNNTPGYGYYNWTVPWGTLTGTLINPNISINVTRNKFFNFTAKVTCTGGECGYINATLDPPLGWWNNSWNYRRRITLAENAARNLTNYQFNVTLDTSSLIAAGKMNGTCNDIRFVDNASKELDYWIKSGCNTTTTLVWVEYNLSASSNATLYVYYGNSNAVAASNGSKTMFIYEDMTKAPEGTLTGSATYIDSTWGVRMTAVVNDQISHFYYARNPGPGFVAHYRTWAGGGTGADSTFIGAYDNSVGGTREDIVDGGYHFTVDEWQDRVAFTKSTTDNGAPIASWANTTLDDSQWHDVDIIFFNNGTAARDLTYYDNALRINSTDGTPQAITGTYFLFGGRTGGSTNNHYVNNVEVRRYVKPEPTVTLDVEIAQTKGIIPMNNGTPFYTTNANPMLPANNSCLADMRPGSACNVTWLVNATGTTSDPWEFFVTYQSMNYSSSVNDAITPKINITIVDNIAPNVSYISIKPDYPLPTEDLNCSFTVTDPNYYDTLSANVSWYRNGIYYSSTNMSVSSGVLNSVILGSGNLSLGQTWYCGVKPYDGTVYGSQVNSSNVTITNSKPPTINQIQCLINNSVWTNCSSLSFNSNFSGVRANCTTSYRPISNVTFNFTNTPDSKLLLYNTTSVNSSDWWTIYQNITINDSGEFIITAVCMNNESANNTKNVTWTVPWGTLVATLIDPNSNRDVESNKFFNFTAQVQCIGGECGDVTALLDPQDQFNGQPVSPPIQLAYQPYQLYQLYQPRQPYQSYQPNQVVNKNKPVTGTGNKEYPNGLVTLNSIKPVYIIGEKAELVGVVLNSKGELVSSANLNLRIRITRPDNKENLFTSFTSDDIKEIRKGLYALIYDKLDAEGKYSVEFVSEGSVKDSMVTSFDVDKKIEFDIIRETPFAINPWDGKGVFESRIQVRLGKLGELGESIQAQEPVKGFGLTEVLPPGLEVIDAGNANVWKSGNATYLTWSDLQNNAWVSYTATAQKISPNRYALQSFISLKGRIIEEARPWFIAVDPTYYYSAVNGSLALASSTSYTIANGSNYTNTVIANCVSGNCSQTNAWVTGFINLGAVGASCQLNTTLIFNISNIKPEYINNITMTWGGCWHGDEVLTDARCDNVSRPKFTSGTGGGTFDMWVYKNGTYEKMDCVPTVGTECGGSNDINLGTNILSPSWGNAHGYHTFKFQKTSLNSSYANNSIIRIVWRTWGGLATCSDAAPNNDILLALDYANLTVNWNYLIKSGPVSTIAGAEPFYTTIANPQTKDNASSCLGSMVAGRVCNITWPVNATGGINTTHEFYVIFNTTTYNTTVNASTTAHINLTIRDTSKVAPVVTLVSPANNNATSNPDVVFNCSATDNTGLMNMTLFANFTGTFQENGTNDISGLSNSTTFNRTLADGRYLWNCMAYDIDGNLAWGASNRTLTVDTQAPTINLSSPDYNESVYVGTLNFSFTAVDNIASNITCNITIDSIVKDANFNATNNTLKTRTIGGLNQSTHYWNVTCWDYAGNKNTSETRNFTVIDLPPTVNLTTPDNYSQNSPDITLYYYASDNNNVTLAVLYIDGAYEGETTEVTNNANNTFNATGLEEGRYNWTVNVSDISDLSAQAPVRWFIIDFTAPRINLTAPPDGFITNSSNVTFNFTAADNLASAMLCNITINGTVASSNINASNNTPTVKNVSGIPDGISYWNVTCKDAAGNVNTSETRMLNISSPPIVNLTWPPDNYSQKSVNITLNYTPSDNTGLANCSLILNGVVNQTNATINNNVQNVFRLQNLSLGYYNWTVTCNDTSGLTSQVPTPRSFLIDYVSPNITLNYPQPNDTLYIPAVNFNYTAYDSLDANLTCNLTLDGSVNKTNLSSYNGIAVNVTINVGSEGTHYWNVTCRDRAGNANTSETRNFTIYMPPVVTLMSPDNRSIFNNGTNISFAYIATDYGTLTNASLIINSVINQTTPNPPKGVQNYFYVNFTEDGVYNWSVNATNNRNLTGASEKRIITIDTKPPNVTIITPYNNQNITNNNVTFTFNVTDNLASNMTCNISVNGNITWSNISANNKSTITRNQLMHDGSYNWSVTCWDNANNTNPYTLINFTVEAPPNITLNFPYNSYRTTNQNITFNYTPYDGYGIANCSLYIDGVQNSYSLMIANNLPNYLNPLSNISEGDHNWSILCYDDPPDSNSAMSAYRNFSIDLSGPIINLTSPNESEYLNNNNVTFNWTAADYPSTSVLCNLTVDGVLNQSNINKTSGSVFNVTLRNMIDGPHNWNVTCMDNLNNTRTSETRNFTVNQPDFYIDDSRISFNNTNPDLYQNITIRANVSNIGGMTMNSVLVEFWDNGMPGIGTFIGNATANVPNNASVLFNTTWNITPGYHTIYVLVDPYNALAELNETNNNATANISVLRVFFNSPPNYTITNDTTPEINFTMQDFTGGIINYTIYVDGSANGQTGNSTDNMSVALNLSALSQGYRNITVQARDALGRSKNSSKLVIIIDTTAPAVHFVNQNQTWFNLSSPNIYFNITDNIDTNINYSVYLNGTFQKSSNISNNTMTNETLGPLEDGIYNITIQTIDDANNSANYTLRIYVDTIPPSINLTYPADGANFTIRNVSLNFTATDNLAQSLKCNLTLDGILNRTNFTALNATETKTSISGLAEGAHYWNITCWDNATNINTSETRTFNIFIAPVINLTAPANGNLTNKPNQTFYFNVSDETGILNCSIILNGVINTTKSGSQITNNATNNITVDNMNGKYNWSIRCYDNTTMQMQGDSTNWTITVDIDAPYPNITTANYTWFNNTSPLISFIITDNFATQINYTFYVNGTANVSGTVNNNTPSTTNLQALNENSSYTITLQATDNATNSRNSSSIIIYIDTAKPAINLSAPQNGEITNSSTVQFNFTTTDNMAPYTMCNLTISNGMNQSNINATNNTIQNITKSGFTSGIYYWNVSCTDLAGNKNTSATYNLTVDLVAPVVHFETRNGSWFNYSTPIISFNITDNYDNNINYTVYVNGSVDQSGNITNYTSTSVNLSSVSEGIYNITIRATDDVNNSANYSIIIYVNLMPPIMTLYQPAPADVFNYNNIYFNWTATDFPNTNITCNLSVSEPLGGRNTSITKLSGSYFNTTLNNLSDGIHYWNITCIDNVNNSNTSETRNFTITQPDLYLNNSRISFNNTNPDLYQNITIRANVSNIGGVPANNVLVEFWDNGMPGIGTFIGNATATILNGESALFNTTWNITPGYHTIYVLADPYNAIVEMNETNNNATANISVLVSNITYPQNNTIINNNTPLIIFNVTDYTTNNITYRIYVDGSFNGQTGNVTSGSNTSLFLNMLSDGSHAIKVQATDVLGRSKNSSILNITIDTQSPVVRFVAQNLSWFNTSNPNIYFNITDNYASNINYSIYVNGTFQKSSNISNNTMTNETLGPLVDGRYNITVQATDDVNNTANYTIIIYVDIQPPAINLTYPADGTNFTTRNVSLNFTATDNLAQSLKCNLTLDGILNRTNFTAQNATETKTTISGLTEATHNWNVTCWDNATNINTSETRTFNIFIAPVINLTAPANGNLTNKPNQTFYFNVSDDTGILNCSLLLNGAINTTKPGSQLTNNAVNNFTVNNMSGKYNWSVRCYDNTTMQMQGDSTNWTITVDTDAPYPNITTANYTWFNNTSPLISFIIRDNFATQINYTFYVNGTANVSGTVNNNTPSTTNLQALNENSSYTITLQATDNATNSRNSSSIIIYIDTAKPNINLSYPTNGLEVSSTSVQFNFTVTDNMAPYTMCNLTISNGMNQTNINATNNTIQNITKSGFVAGTYFWNVSCTDLAGNKNMSETWNFTVRMPDLIITSSNITFNNSAPEEGQNITIFANVYNIGGSPATNFVVQFWKGDPDAGGAQINGNKTIANLTNGNNITVNVTYNVTIGNNNIFVLVDANNSVAELNESNNKANNSLNVSLYQVYAGNTTGIIDMEKQTINKSLYQWNVSNATGSNIFVADLEATPNFLSLQAIGRDTSNATTSNDFTDIDTALNSTNFSDSINNTFTANNAPKDTRNITVFSKTINYVPIVNSTNVSSFVTGILWDTYNGNTEYNGTQNLVFITQINKSQQGSRGLYDFEIKVPALLRNYNSPGTSVAFYSELK